MGSKTTLKAWYVKRLPIVAYVGAWLINSQATNHEPYQKCSPANNFIFKQTRRVSGAKTLQQKPSQFHQKADPVLGSKKRAPFGGPFSMLTLRAIPWGRGMGSPIPSHQEGAWVREDPKVVGGGFLTSVRWSLRPGTMKEHGYVTLPSRSVGAVLGDLGVSTDAAWSTGHSAIHSLVTWSEESFSSMIDSVDGQASSVNPCVWTHWVLFSEGSTVVHAKGGQVHFPWLVVVFGVTW